MKNKIVVLLILMSLLLTSCNKSDKLTDEVDNTDNEVVQTEEPAQILDDGTRSFLEMLSGIDRYKLTEALQNISDAKEQFDCSTLEITSYHDSEVSKVSALDMHANDNTSVVDSKTSIELYAEYKNNSEYVDSLTVSSNYYNEDDFATLESYSLKMLQGLISPEIYEQILKIPYQSTPTVVYETDDVILSVTKINEDLTEYFGYRNLSYAISVNMLGESSIDNRLYLSDNMKSGIYKTTLASYPSEIEYTEQRIKDYYGDTATIELVNYYFEDFNNNGENKATTNVEWKVTNKRDTDQFEYSVNFASIESNEVNNLYIALDTSVIDLKSEAFYMAEEIIQSITGDEVELDKFVSENEFKVECSGENLNTNFGFPLVVTGNVVEENNLYKIHLVFKTVDNMEEQ